MASTNTVSTDITFITNENGQNLLERFKVLIKDTKYFDVLVGYFYISGFYALYKELEKTEKIRILIGLNTDNSIHNLLSYIPKEGEIILSHDDIKEHFSKLIENEITKAEDKKEIEEGIVKFIEWVYNKKLEIKMYETRDIHAKLYIMSFPKEDRDKGRVITGSSNFTQAGLVDNLEFNVELKNYSDYLFAKTKFDELWENAVDVTKECINTITQKTWLRDNVTPYELYLKFLYEYFKDQLEQKEELFYEYLPKGFKKLEYQEQAVLNAKKILEEHGGVFLSDVVGLGKTYMAAMLASQLDGRTLVIAPPALIDKKNPGSWPNVFSDFRIAADFESIGKLDNDTINPEKYKNIIIDEAHRFRNETNISYENLTRICRGKRVILVTATPYNNSPKDILNQIKLFQNSKKSTIPGLPNLEKFFNALEKNLNNIDKRTDYDNYIKVVRDNAKQIREKVLKYLMVRRTRAEISKYFAKDLISQKIKFPEVEPPKALFYQLNKSQNDAFEKTIELLSKKLTYARYTPLLQKYYKGNINQLEEQSQKNVGCFMKILLIKRLESSFYAFNKSIERFISSYETFIKTFEKDKKVYISKGYSKKLFEYLQKDDDDAIEKLIESGKVDEYNASDFKPDFLQDLKNDLKILKGIQALWKNVNINTKNDPKLQKLLSEIQNNEILNQKKNKLIIFTESKETAEYLEENINKKFHNTAICFTGNSDESMRSKVINNFDPNASEPKDDYRILISTDVLAEGVNLHRSNVIINYDIPWNPTRMIQRVGRINRVNTKFDKIYTFNFFPTEQANEHILLEQTAKSKINAFLTLLGGDAELLTEGEPIDSHTLFDRLLSKKTFSDEQETEESELKYLTVIKDIQNNNPELFEEIKKLPQKARTAKNYPNITQIQNQFHNSLITYFRQGKIQKFFVAQNEIEEALEIDFMTAAALLESNLNNKREELPQNFYELLDKNKKAFNDAMTQEIEEKGTPVQSNYDKLYSILKATLSTEKKLEDDKKKYILQILNQLTEGNIPKKTVNKTLKSLNGTDIQNSDNVLKVLKNHISDELLQKHYAEQISTSSSSQFKKQEIQEVILSMYLKK